jgi:Sec-independent protein translocase protein TatA
MFGRKKARELIQAARAAIGSERTGRAAKAAKLRWRQLAEDIEPKQPTDMSPAEMIKAQRDSRAERAKSAPCV